jgi:hypothetical protein
MTSTLKLATAALFGLAAFAASDASAFTYHTSSALRLRPTSQPTVSRPVARSLTSSTAAKLAPYTMKGAGAAKVLFPNSGPIIHPLLFPGGHYTPPAPKILIHTLPLRRPDVVACVVNPSACASPPPQPVPPIVVPLPPVNGPVPVGLAPLAPVAAVAAAAAPATQLPPNPCSCLSKTRLQDGRIFFQDVCTGDAAVYPATPVAPAPAT